MSDTRRADMLDALATITAAVEIGDPLGLVLSLAQPSGEPGKTLVSAFVIGGAGAVENALEAAAELLEQAETPCEHGRLN